MYLLTSSCHPNSCKRSIPYSLALRITRICTEPETREKRYKELKDMLIERGYSSGLIDAAIRRARNIPRNQALQYFGDEKAGNKNSNPTRRPVHSVTFDPRLPTLPLIHKKHCRAMVFEDPHIIEVFPDPPLVAYKRNINPRDLLI